MTDLELTQLVAEAMGIRTWTEFGNEILFPDVRVSTGVRYDPLHDDAQAMALVKHFRLTVVWTDRLHDGWLVRGWYSGKKTGMPLSEEVDNADLNRAIVEVVATMAGVSR